MKRTFTFQEDNSQKFWSIELNGSGFMVTFGKLGTAGQTLSKDFESEHVCQCEVEKLIKSKIKKGYIELVEDGVTRASKNLISASASTPKSMPKKANKALVGEKEYDNLKFELTKDGKGYSVSMKGGSKANIEELDFQGQKLSVYGKICPPEDAEFDIPSTYKGKPVTHIGTSYKNLSKTALHSGEYAFRGCSNLTSIKIPSSVKTIGAYAFHETGLTDLVIPDTVTSIDYAAFASCKSLKSVVISNAVTSLENSVFSECTSLKNLIIPDSITSIGEHTFRDCESLNIVIPRNVKHIGQNAFCRYYGHKDVKSTKISVIGRDKRPNGWNEFWNGSGSTYLKCEDVTWDSNVQPDGAYILEYYTVHFIGDFKNLNINESEKKVKNLGGIISRKFNTKVTLLIAGEGLQNKIEESAIELYNVTVMKTGSFETAFGITYVYKIEDAEGNVYGWNTSKEIEKANGKHKFYVKGSFKNKTKSRINLTRCTVAEIIDEEMFKKLCNGDMDSINSFNSVNDSVFTKEMQQFLNQKAAVNDLSVKQKQLLQSFIAKHAIPCYYFEKLDEKPTALDSSLGGVPYLPESEKLPGEDRKLLMQINFEGVELKGYPDKGIFQLFADDEETIEGCGNDNTSIRFYSKITDKHQKNLEMSNHDMADCKKLKLVKGWSMFPTNYSSEGAKYFENCKILTELEEEFEGESFWDILYEMFPTRSNIGGYFHTPQGMGGRVGEDGAWLFLDADLISWGDSGALVFYLDEDIQKVKNDTPIICEGDMC